MAQDRGNSYDHTVGGPPDDDDDTDDTATDLTTSLYLYTDKACSKAVHTMHSYQLETRPLQVG